MTSSHEEVWADDGILLTFDGRVLEVFGLVETRRFHTATGLTLDVPDGTLRKCRIRTRVGIGMSFRCDPERVAALRALAAVIAAGPAQSS